LLILPSKFDTFSCSVLEAISCGLPVIAYNIKGPKDIIQSYENGFLVNNQDEMYEQIHQYILNPHLHGEFRHRALKRSQEYRKDFILDKLLTQAGLKTDHDIQ